MADAKLDNVAHYIRRLVLQATLIAAAPKHPLSAFGVSTQTEPSVTADFEKIVGIGLPWEL